MAMKATKSKNHVLLTRPAAAARLLSGQGQGGGRSFKKKVFLAIGSFQNRSKTTGLSKDPCRNPSAIERKPYKAQA